MHVVIFGCGYVGIPMAILLAQKHDVVAVDIDADKVKMLNARKSPIKDSLAEEYLAQKPLNLLAVTAGGSYLKEATCIIVATPTNFCAQTNRFDTSSVDHIVQEALALSEDATIVIKSTVPIGYTQGLACRHKTGRILFAPEFLREGSAVQDSLYPSRIIVGSDESAEGVRRAREFAQYMAEVSLSPCESRVVGAAEAESIKLFSNTFLALRVAFFNEIDTFAQAQHLDAKTIIQGVCADSRIGDYYNNPSFGYGGYCLPKDTKQVLANYGNIPNSIMKAVVEANRIRKDYIADQIVQKEPNVVGFYRAAMKKGSDNFRQSSILGVLRRVHAKGVKTVLYEPEYDGDELASAGVVRDLEEFKSISDVIVANRYEKELDDVRDKVFTRDLFYRD